MADNPCISVAERYAPELPLLARFFLLVEQNIRAFQDLGGDEFCRAFREQRNAFLQQLRHGALMLSLRRTLRRQIEVLEVNERELQKIRAQGPEPEQKQIPPKTNISPSPPSMLVFFSGGRAQYPEGFTGIEHRVFTNPPNSQIQSLFSILPPEIRVKIWGYCLSIPQHNDHQSNNQPYLPLPSRTRDHHLFGPAATSKVFDVLCGKTPFEFTWSPTPALRTQLDLSLVCQRFYNEIIPESVIYKENTIFLTNHPDYTHRSALNPIRAHFIKTIHFKLFIQPHSTSTWEGNFKHLEQLYEYPNLKYLTLELIFRDDAVTPSWDEKKFFVSDDMLMEVKELEIFGGKDGKRGLKGLRDFALWIQVQKRKGVCTCKGMCPRFKSAGAIWKGSGGMEEWKEENRLEVWARGAFMSESEWMWRKRVDVGFEKDEQYSWLEREIRKSVCGGKLVKSGAEKCSKLAEGRIWFKRERDELYSQLEKEMRKSDCSAIAVSRGVELPLEEAVNWEQRMRANFRLRRAMSERDRRIRIREMDGQKGSLQTDSL